LVVRRTGYLLATFPLATLVFCLMVTLVAAGVGTAVVWVGLPILAVTIRLALAFATAERRRLAWAGYGIGQLPGPETTVGQSRQTGNRLLAWLKRSLLSATGWRAVLHGVLNFPLSVASFCITVTWWAFAVFGLTEWLWRPAVPWDACFATIGYCDVNGEYRTLVDIWHIPLPQVAFDFGVGLVCAVTLPAVLMALTWLHAALAQGLLAPTQGSLKRRIDQLAATRAGVMAAQDEDLRRIERDIHDGPQQRLIRVGMDLSAAQRRLEAGDAEAASQLIDQAKRFSDEAVAELRALARGIAPPILADRGLAAALEAACAASPVPAKLDLDLAAGRLPAAVETTLYFTATEALANAAKHSGATAVTVTAQAGPGMASLVVADNGRGGGQVIPGHGLAGLAARASALDGRFHVDTVEGGGTRVTVEVEFVEGGAG
jgi:signal transduction histidine kinase